MDEAVKAMEQGINEDSGVTASEAVSEARDITAGDAQCEAAALKAEQESVFGDPIDTKYEFLAWKKGDTGVRPYHKEVWTQ